MLLPQHRHVVGDQLLFYPATIGGIDTTTRYPPIIAKALGLGAKIQAIQDAEPNWRTNVSTCPKFLCYNFLCHHVYLPINSPTRSALRD